MQRLKKLVVAFVVWLLQLAAMPFILIYEKLFGSSDENHPSKELDEATRTRRVIIIMFLLFLASLVSMFFQRDFKELAMNTKGDGLGKFDKKQDNKKKNEPSEEEKKKKEELVKEILAGGEEQEQDQKQAMEKGKAPKPQEQAPQSAAKGSPPLPKSGGGGGGGGTAGSAGGGGGGSSSSSGTSSSSSSSGGASFRDISGQQQGKAGNQADRSRQETKEQEEVQPQQEEENDKPPVGPPIVHNIRVAKGPSNERRVFADVTNYTGKDLNHVEVVVKFYNARQELLGERRVNALVVSGGLFGDTVAPMKANESRNFSVGVDDIPSGWSDAKVQAEIQSYE